MKVISVKVNVVDVSEFEKEKSAFLYSWLQICLIPSPETPLAIHLCEQLLGGQVRVLQYSHAVVGAYSILKNPEKHLWSLDRKLKEVLTSGGQVGENCPYILEYWTCTLFGSDSLYNSDSGHQQMIEHRGLLFPIGYPPFARDSTGDSIKMHPPCPGMYHVCKVLMELFQVWRMRALVQGWALVQDSNQSFLLWQGSQLGNWEIHTNLLNQPVLI